MEIKQLQYFFEVYKEKSFSKAAQNLFITQQGISKSISTLEDELDVKLFIRKKSGIEVTPEGEYLKKQTEKIFRYVDETENNIKKIRNGNINEIRVSLINGARSIFPINITEKYNSTLNNVKIVMKERLDCKCIEDVSDGVASAAITVYPKRKNDLRIYPLTKERLCIVANKDNSLSKKKIINLNDIEKNDLILLNGQQQSNETLKKFLVDNMVDVNIAYEVPSFLSALELCRENLGIVITLEKIMKNITYPDVVTIPIEEKVFVWELYYIFKKDTSKQMETMHFYKYLLDYLDDYKK